MTRAYLDYNATAPLKPEVQAAMAAYWEQPLNPSSVHREGQNARALVDQARRHVATLVGACADNVYFTASATEANNWILRQPGFTTRLVSAIEHPSVANAVPDAARFPVTPEGVIDLDALADLLKHVQTPALVSIMLVNNETGVIQPVTEAAQLVHAAGALLHCDAVQAAGKISVDITALGVDFLTLSAHKIGGPQGVGALVTSGHDVEPFLLGGRQENRRRAGTENVIALVGFGKAAILADHSLDLTPYRDRIEQELLAVAPDLKIIGRTAPRVCNTTMMALPGLSAETQLIALDMDGIAVGTGAACSSGRIEPSPVLTAMGWDAETAKCAIRVSLGWNTQLHDVERFIESWTKLYRRHQRN